MLSLLDAAPVTVSSSVLDFLILLVLLYFSFHLLLLPVYNLVFHPLRRLPGPLLARSTPFWLFSRVLHLDRNAKTHALLQEYGPVVRISPKHVLVDDESLLLQAYSTGPKTWRKSPWYASWTFNGESPLFAECDYTRHAAMKKISSSIYLLRNLRPFQDESKRISFEDLVTFVRREGKNGAQELDLLKVFRYYAFDSISLLAFDQRYDLLKDSKHLSVIDDLDHTAIASTMRSRLPSWLYFAISSIPLPAVQHLFSAPHRLWSHGMEVYDAYEAKVMEGKATDRMSAVRNLYEAMDPTSGRRMKRSTAAGEMTSHIFGGTDTTSCTLTYAMWELSRRPEIAAKLFEEIAMVIASCDFAALPKDEVLAELPYLDAFIKETCRLYTPAPSMLERVVPDDGVIIAGHFIPAGTIVGSQAYSFHRRASVFSDPYEFNPERWFDETNEMRKIYIPFGKGEFACGGRAFALFSLRWTIAVMSRFFTFEAHASTTDESMDMRDAFVMFPRDHRCLMYAHPRSDI